jgi:hypothetical protein
MYVALCALPAEARNFVKMLAERPDNNCFRLLVDVVENWIKAMADIFPKTAAGIQNVQIDFDRGRELRLQSFVTGFMAEYDAYSFQLIPSGISKIIFGNLGRFLHHMMFKTWSHSKYGSEKPPVEFPVDCLVGKYAHPVIYYVTGWMLYSVSKALTTAREKRPLVFLNFQWQILSTRTRQKVQDFLHLSWRRGSVSNQFIPHVTTSNSYASSSVPWSGTFEKVWLDNESGHHP